MRVGLAWLLAAATWLLATAPAASAELVAPRSAAALRDSVGVNTHIAYYDTAYADWPRLVAKLEDLGVRHLRDAVYANPGWGDWNERYYRAVELAASRGMRFTFLMGRPGNDAGTVDQLVEIVSGRLRPAVEALEAPNEYDYFVGGRRWPSLLASYVRDLHRKANARPSLRELPMVGPSLKGWDGPKVLGDQSAWLDRGSIHPYTGGRSPDPEQLRTELLRAKAVSGQKPVWATEAGFHNALRTDDGHAPVSEAAAAVYAVRTVLENFQSGIGRTYFYELVDQTPEPGNRDPEQHFGLLRHDYSEKPAFRALENLIATVGDDDRRGRLEPLNMTIAGAAARDLRRLVLQKADGTYVVALWRLASVWDAERRRDTPVSRRRLVLGIPRAARIRWVDPVSSTAMHPLRLRRGRVRLEIGGRPLLLHVTPQKAR